MRSRQQYAAISQARRVHAHARGRSAGFTLLELLAVIATIGVISAMLLPALNRGKRSARSIACLSNLRQLAIATQLYWDDNAGQCFRYGGVVTNDGRLYWFGWMGPGAEGERTFDAAQGVLHPYLRGKGVELCPSFNYLSGRTKLKATGASFGYGYNLYLSAGPRETPVRVDGIRAPSNTALFADAAQVNTWQAPASPEQPMVEEWYYVDNSSNQPNGHFRHAARANVAYCDGHAGSENFVPGSVDPRLPSEMVARLRPEILSLP